MIKVYNKDDIFTISCELNITQEEEEPDVLTSNKCKVP